MDKVALAYKNMLDTFATSLNSHMPPSFYRDFQQWALSDTNPNQHIWHQIIGLPQFAKLTVTLLDGLVADDKWQELMKFASVMNTYLIYETLSDNLAIGLARKIEDYGDAKIRKKSLQIFNEAMVARLKEETTRSKALMEGIRGDLRAISAFQQSLTLNEQQKIALGYVATHSNVTLEDIEYNLWSALVANIETCALVTDSLKSFRSHELLRNGLVWRYQAVGQLLTDGDFSLEEIKAISVQTILVMPVLTYYIAVLAEHLYPNPHLQTVLENGELTRALENAALMVRLTNDWAQIW
jgi:hypothetical protein